MSTEVLIELDTAAPAPQSGHRPPAYRYRPVGLVLAVALLLTLAGSVPAVTPMWQRAGLVSTERTDTVFEVAGDRLYVSIVEGSERITSGYAMYPLRRLWSTRTPDDDARVQLDVAGDHLVVQVGRYIDILDAGSGRVRWTSPAPLQPLSGGRTGLTQEAQFRPGTEYDESSGEPGMLYYAADGTAHTQPPERTVLYGVDLADGHQRWSVSLPGAIYAAPGPTDPPSVLVVSSDRLQLLDADSGEVRTQQQLPAGPARVTTYSEVVGDLVMLYHSEAETYTVNAYHSGTLAPLWSRPVQDGAGNSHTCIGLPCERLASTLAVLDPRSGAVRWETNGAVGLVSRGRYTFEVGGTVTQARPLRTVNPVTGAEQADLSGWQSYAQGPADTPLVLTRRDAANGTAFGVLLPGRRVVRETGRSEVPLIGCRSSAGLIACDSALGVEVFTYRA